jgi:hypothetical protein
LKTSNSRPYCIVQVLDEVIFAFLLL